MKRIIFISSIISLIIVLNSCRNLNNELEGVWRGEKSESMIVINFNTDKPFIKVDNDYYYVITKDIVSNNTAVVVKVRKGQTSDVWTFRATYEDFTKSYSFFWKKENGFEDKLIFIRNL